MSSFSFLYANNYIKAAEKINIEFEEMRIPLTIEQLYKLETYKKDSKELIDWFTKNGFKRIFEISNYLDFPIFKEGGLTRQVLRSWIGRKVLTELSNTIIVPNDKDGVEVFNTLARQQNLLKKLKTYEKVDRNISHSKIFNVNKVEKINKKIYTSHRVKPLNIEIWKPKNEPLIKDLIIFMPGLGGDIKNFRWIGIELSKRGWPIAFIDHDGSNSRTIKEVIKGKEALPTSADFFLYRIMDLDTVIKAYKNGELGIKKNSYILMGHSLGSLISFLYEGNLPDDGFESRCESGLVDFAITNLSKLLQCQLTEIPLPKIQNNYKPKAIIGFNTFGSLIWPKKQSSGIDFPVLLIGGTYDLLTPLISEQFKVFLSTSFNSLNRFLIIEGASHFSPIRINNDNNQEKKGDDIFKINKSFIGSYPFDVQNLSLKIIVEFINGIEREEPIKVLKKQKERDLNYHILDRKEIKEISID